MSECERERERKRERKKEREREREREKEIRKETGKEIERERKRERERERKRGREREKEIVSPHQSYKSRQGRNRNKLSASKSVGETSCTSAKARFGLAAIALGFHHYRIRYIERASHEGVHT